MLFNKSLATFGRYLMLMGPVGRRLHRNRPPDILLHRRSDLHPDQAEHPKPVDA